jgi:hypothetical protein
MGLVSNRIDPVLRVNWLRPVGYTFRFLVTLFKDAYGGSYTAGELYPYPHIGGKAGVFKVVTFTPGERITVLWNQTGAHAPYTPRRQTNDGITYDAHDNIVLPMRDRQGVSYDRYATATYRLPAYAARATVYDKYGNAVTLREGQTVEINNRGYDGSLRPVAQRTTISERHGVYVVQLRGGETYSDPDDPRIPTVGGDPVIIVEPIRLGAGQRGPGALDDGPPAPQP